MWPAPSTTAWRARGMPAASSSCSGRGQMWSSAPVRTRRRDRDVSERGTAVRTRGLGRELAPHPARTDGVGHRLHALDRAVARVGLGERPRDRRELAVAHRRPRLQLRVVGGPSARVQQREPGHATRCLTHDLQRDDRPERMAGEREPLGRRGEHGRGHAGDRVVEVDPRHAHLRRPRSAPVRPRPTATRRRACRARARAARACSQPPAARPGRPRATRRRALPALPGRPPATRRRARAYSGGPRRTLRRARARVREPATASRNASRIRFVATYAMACTPGGARRRSCSRPS